MRFELTVLRVCNPFPWTTRASVHNSCVAIRHTPTLNWSEYEGSNLGPPGPKPGALPGCAILRVFYFTLGS